MFEQTKQVAITYATQRYMWLFAGLAVMIIGPNLMMFIGHPPSPADAAGALLFILGLPMLFTIPFLVGQIKTQFAHPRARLTPQFFPAHLVVVAGILITLFIIYPLILVGLSRFEPLGLLALAFAVGLPLIWGTQLNRFSGLLVALVVIYSLLSHWGQNWWLIEAAQHRPAHAAVSAAGVALLIAWMWRICHLHEEQDDYQNLNQMMVARRTGSEAIEQRRIVATQAGRNWLAARVGDWWHDRIGGYFGGSRSGLVRLLSHGLGAQPVEFQGLLFAAMILSVGIFMTQFTGAAKSGANFGGYFFFAQFAVLLPGQMAGESMAQRRPRIAFEILTPVLRVELVDALLMAVIRNSIVLWLMMNIVLGLVVLLNSDQLLLGTAAMFVLLSGAIMFATMAVSLRVSVWPSRAKRLLVLVPAWGVLIVPIVVWTSPVGNVGQWLIYSAVILGVIGLLAAGTALLYGATGMAGSRIRLNPMRRLNEIEVMLFSAGVLA